ncbi:MAG: 16S rRNA (guanine(527)-N(7))-methyltransferase RsmG [Lachnospiraceae bacterium]|nr:16S rRNA (guanine(527)-N(7))-methyltransferase RsmG [Lachnospiraceae bacterium]
MIERIKLLENLEYFCDELKKININISEKQIEQFNMYYDMLIEWNKVMNLTAIVEEMDVINKHFVDSLLINCIKQFEYEENKDIKLIDIGTGAGFPGIPIKIIYPEVKVTLLDSLNKRINFLNEVINKLDLSDIETIHGRAEELGRNAKYREQYDYVVSRAVSNLSTLSEYCIPFVKKEGYFISYKAQNSDDEVKNANNAIEKLGGKVFDDKIVTIPSTDIDRRFVVIKKVKVTDKKYPRGQGKPVKNPL